jgi:hypothetical protein
MMRRALMFAAVGALCGCSIEEEPPAPRARQIQSQQLLVQPGGEPSDPIDALVAQLTRTGGMWLNGLSPVLELPENASTEELVAEFFQKVSYEQGQIKSHTIADSRRVTITPGIFDDQYTAVLVDTNLGRKILLLQYSKNGGWWSRVYDA